MVISGDYSAGRHSFEPAAENTHDNLVSRVARKLGGMAGDALGLIQNGWLPTEDDIRRFEKIAARPDSHGPGGALELDFGNFDYVLNARTILAARQEQSPTVEQLPLL